MALNSSIRETLYVSLQPLFQYQSSPTNLSCCRIFWFGTFISRQYVFDMWVFSWGLTLETVDSSGTLFRKTYFTNVPFDDGHLEFCRSRWGGKKNKAVFSIKVKKQVGPISPIKFWSMYKYWYTHVPFIDFHKIRTVSSAQRITCLS